MLGIVIEAWELRLALWHRLVVDGRLPIDDIDAALRVFAASSNDEEKRAFVLLRAAAKLSESGSDSLRRTLRGAILYWFSCAGSKNDPAPTDAINPSYLPSVIGRHLTWSECATFVGMNPDNYTAYRRLVEKLGSETEEQWHEVFGKTQRFGDVHDA